MTNLQPPREGGTYQIDDITGEYVKIAPAAPVVDPTPKAPVAGDQPKSEKHK